jgi:hypothetical protein
MHAPPALGLRTTPKRTRPSSIGPTRTRAPSAIGISRLSILDARTLTLTLNISLSDIRATDHGPFPHGCCMHAGAVLAAVSDRFISLVTSLSPWLHGPSRSWPCTLALTLTLALTASPLTLCSRPHAHAHAFDVCATHIVTPSLPRRLTQCHAPTSTQAPSDNDDDDNDESPSTRHHTHALTHASPTRRHARARDDDGACACRQSSLSMPLQPRCLCYVDS